MNQPASAKPKAFRRARAWLAILMAVGLGAAVAAVAILTPFGRSLELRVSDFLRAAAALPDLDTLPGDVPITIIGVDDASLKQYGHWPWAWSRLADIIEVLEELGARMVVLDIEFPEEDTPRVVKEIGPDGRPVERIIHTVDRLVETVRTTGNVVIPFSLYYAERPMSSGLVAASPSDAAPAAAPNTTADTPPPAVLDRFAVSIPPSAVPGLKPAEGFQPMIPPLAAACAGSGCTSVLHDAEDGVIRRVPLLIRGGGKVYPHLMLEVAGLWRFGPGYRVGFSGDRLTLSSADGKESVAVPVSQAAQLELRWPTSIRALNSISIVPALGIVEQRQRNRTVMAQLDAIYPREGWAAARRAVDEARLRLVGHAPDAPTRAAFAELQKTLTAAEERLAMNLLTAANEPLPANADEKARRLRRLADDHLDFVGALHDPKDGIETKTEQLRAYVDGRLCFLGYFATGIADLHTTAIGNAQPGVTVYPPGIRTIVSGVAFRHPGDWAEWAISILAAAIVAVTTVHLSTWRGVAATMVLSVLVLAAAWTASARAALLLPVAGPVMAMAVGFAGVSVYRQLTEASSRRWITRAFQQYGSPELLEELMQDPDRLRLGGERLEITAFFSDIAGFTPLSEKLEPERLVALLNRYLSAMTDIVLSERAALDKYEGDAIIAMFGALVRLPDHAERGVRAALRMKAALPQVNQELLALDLLPSGTVLAMRIGLATGPAIVGNFGSEQRFNYTGMGDTMNLASRLEEANRWLGSGILVPESTYQACRQAVLFRRFGPAKIRGKAQPVRVHEPLAMEPAPADLKAVAEAFNRSIDALSAGDIPAAEAALADLLAIRPDDRPAKALGARIAAVKAGQAAPDDPWDLTKSK